MILLNEKLSGEQAHKIGLVDYIANDFVDLMKVFEGLKGKIDKTVA